MDHYEVDLTSGVTIDCANNNLETNTKTRQNKLNVLFLYIHTRHRIISCHHLVSCKPKQNSASSLFRKFKYP